MEFSPDMTKQLGENEIDLWIACWKSGWVDSVACDREDLELIELWSTEIPPQSFFQILSSF